MEIKKRMLLKKLSNWIIFQKVIEEKEQQLEVRANKIMKTSPNIKPEVLKIKGVI